MRRLVVGVIGHVDHGKTALVAALTGQDTDRLPEEKARGISIALGFAHLTGSDGTVVDLIDMPGHERFVRTMVAGATGIDAVLLVVAANEGIKPQTREHVEIAGLLGIRRALVAVELFFRFAFINMHQKVPRAPSRACFSGVPARARLLSTKGASP